MVQKYIPTRDGLLDFFQTMIKGYFWKGPEISQMIKLNLEKYNLIEDYKWYSTNLKIVD